ncbi:MAG: hypothetical protein K2X72_06045 [Reyranella sp.]|nr:hypothetical protein [Reyranella sp.]
MSDTTIITTPDALMDLSNALSDFSDALDKIVQEAPDPYTQEMIQLGTLSTSIATDAATIAGIAADLSKPGVLQAIADLKAQVDRAQQTLKQIQNVKLVLSIVGSVLSAAAAISTGNPLAAAGAVVALVNSLSSAIDAATA